MTVIKSTDSKLVYEKKVNGVKGNSSKYNTEKKEKPLVVKIPDPIVVAQVPKYSKSASKKNAQKVGY